MAWFKKKEQIVEEEIPELPELPNPNEFSLPESPASNDFSLPELPNPNEFSLPELPSPHFSVDSNTMPQLPSLPELKNKNNFHPAVIKQEIIKPPQEMQKSHFGAIETRPRQSPPLIRPPQEINEISPRQDIQEINEISPRLNSSTKNVEPIYVRLDKFEASLQSIEEIKRKITEVEGILKKTKEIKQKEEQELELWEREVHIIKSRIGAIDKDIFNKFD
jgi:hypothetical protein